MCLYDLYEITRLEIQILKQYFLHYKKTKIKVKVNIIRSN